MMPAGRYAHCSGLQQAMLGCMRCSELQRTGARNAQCCSKRCWGACTAQSCSGQVRAMRNAAARGAGMHALHRVAASGVGVRALAHCYGGCPLPTLRREGQQGCNMRYLGARTVQKSELWGSDTLAAQGCNKRKVGVWVARYGTVVAKTTEYAPYRSVPYRYAELRCKGGVGAREGGISGPETCTCAVREPHPLICSAAITNSAWFGSCPRSHAHGVPQ